MSKGARAEAWLHTPGRLAWARDHVKRRHKSEQVVSLRLNVPREWLRRRSKGVWTCDRTISPELIQSVNIAGVIQ